MICEICNKNFSEFDGYIQAVAYNPPDENFETKDLEKFKIIKPLCSRSCFEKHKGSNSNYTYYEVYFCPSIKECKFLDNQRHLCEIKEEIEPEVGSSFLACFGANRHKWCEPGVAGMIKSNIKLYKSNLEVKKSIDQFNRSSTDLTHAVIVLTAITIIILLETSFHLFSNILNFFLNYTV